MKYAHLRASRLRFQSALDGGMTLSQVAGASIGFVNTDEGRRCQAEQMAEFWEYYSQKKLMAALNLRGYPSWALCHKYGMSCRDPGVIKTF